jgi:hypothetical protein
MFASKDIFLKSSGGAYQISRSVRLRSSASAYLNRTSGTPTSQNIYTISFWVKRGKLGTSQEILGAGTVSTDAGRMDFLFNSDDTITIAGGLTVFRKTNAVFRDPSAWYHIVLSVSLSGTVNLYVNNVAQTFATSNTWTTSAWNAASTVHRFGYDGSGSFFDGYLTEINFIDGQALTPSSFGETNAVTGVWQPKAYSGTYGTNGFELNFSDNSTAAALGTDFSGNSNTWTVNNISVTAGTTYDSMLDVPTLYADGGNGRGNYATLNPVNVSGGGTTTITDGNLATSVGSTTTFGKVLGSIGMATGKWYWEVTVTAVGGAGNIGIGDGTAPSASFGLGGVAGEIAYQSSGNKYTNNSGTAYGASYTTSDIIGVAYDAGAGSITFYKNNASQGAITGFSGTKFAAVGSGGGTNPQYAINFGQRPFSYTPPTGFVALNTQNLPAPTISNGASYMAATTYTGTLVSNAVSNAVNGVSFQPDLVWIKSRSAATDHELTDSVRGATLSLTSNSTAAEATDLQGLTAFNSGGFTVGTNTTYNNLAATYVGWQWNAGGSTVTNTSGSISAQVRANATAGFSVVTYTGTGSTGTVGHGLGVAPKMIISKNRSAAEEWRVGHIGLTNMASWHINLNGTGAQSNSGAAIWNNTAPTSTIFGVGTDTSVSGNGNLIVAYCFAAVAGYSAFGSYTGNGSADGPFVFCGFRPRFVMFKRTDTTGDWQMYDSSRDTYNVTSNTLYANGAFAEDSNTTNRALDLLSNGFKLRSSASFLNASGGTYIYMAFAENPLKLSLAR